VVCSDALAYQQWVTDTPDMVAGKCLTDARPRSMIVADAFALVPRGARVRWPEPVVPLSRDQGSSGVSAVKPSEEAIMLSVGASGGLHSGVKSGMS
jgi:hypothetical protein